VEEERKNPSSLDDVVEARHKKEVGAERLNLRGPEVPRIRVWNSN